MTAPVFRSIVHPTDFSKASIPAFAHALRIAVGAKSRLHLLNVARREARENELAPFPRVRKTLIKWGIPEADAPRHAVSSTVGLHAVRAQVDDYNVSAGVAAYAEAESCDLLVLMTRGRSGPSRWMYGSVASETARRSCVPALFLRAGVEGFVDRETGAVSLKRALIPIDPAIAPLAARRLVEALAVALQSPCEIKLLSVGAIFELGGDWPYVETREGPLVETIVGYAHEVGADLIAMPTAGRRGLFEALLGSTTERVIIESNQPVLAVPIEAN